MRLFYISLAAMLTFFSQAATAQIQPSNPAGYWRCVVNSPIYSIDVELQINPDQSLMHRGTIVYAQTSRIYNVSGGGRWLLNPPDASSQGYLFRFQMLPQAGNHAMFSVFAQPTGDPGFLQNSFQNPENGAVVQTNCQRLG